MTIPRDGTYEVFVRHPQVSGAATDATFTVTHDGGSAVKTVNQTQNAGTWLSLGSYPFTEDGIQKVTVTDQATGKVLADAVKLVRDNSADVDDERKEFTYRYNPNGLLVEVKDLSPDARIDRYDIAYDQLNQIETVKEYAGSTLRNTTALTYDANGNPLTSTHDLTWSKIEYDERDMVAKVTNADSSTAGNQQISTFTYTARGQLLKQTKPNGNTVDFEYHLDGATKHQLEKTSGGTVVAEHTLEYQANGHPSRDVLKLMNADDTSDHIDNTYVFNYDPQDRVTRLDKSGDSSSTESYVYDANGNTVEQTVDDVTSTSRYDRNRLHSTTTGGVTSTYNYDPLGRLDTVSVGGQRARKYYYDGFDRTAKTTAGIGATAKSTTYVYDPFDRTVSQTTGSKTTLFTYLGMDNQVLREEVAGKATKSYQYAPWGQQLTQIKHTDDGGREYSQFVYRPRGDVIGITKEDGKTRATYGYTAYGKDDDSQFTGVDKPGAQPEGEEPYNAFRFNASRWDAGSGTYDMGFRNYDPGLNRFLTRDSYGGAMADMGLVTDPFTGNRYAFAGGNPVTFVEIDGHLFGMSWSDVGHAALDVVGLVPVVGEVADVANGIWYAAEGNYVDAALSMSSAIPFVGYGATAVKAARTTAKVAEGIDTANDVRKGTDAVRAGDNAPTNTPDATPPRTDTPSAPRQQCNSFVPGTRVLLADGGSKPIEQVQVGDEVMATDVESADNQDRTVTAVVSGRGVKELIKITVDLDGDAGSLTGTVVATSGHPFWLPDVGLWVNASDLKIGMWLRTAAGTWVQVTAVEHEKRSQQVHNFTVAGVHTYYVLVGGTPVLVHNTNPTTPASCPANVPSPRGTAGSREPAVKVEGPTPGVSQADRIAQLEQQLPDFALANRTAKTASRTYVGAMNTRTGQTALASSGGMPGCSSYCAEGNALLALGGNPSEVIFTGAVTVVRNGKGMLEAVRKPVCKGCQADYPRSNFVPGVTAEPGGSWP